MASTAAPACRFAWRPRRNRSGSGRQMLGQSRRLRASAVRRGRRCAVARAGVGWSDRADRRSGAMPMPRSMSACRSSTFRCNEIHRAGHPSTVGAHCSLDSLELAVGLARSGTAAAVVTGPVSKRQLYAIGFAHPGQTEFVAERCGIAPGNVAMMLAGPTLRTVPVTTHIPLSAVPAALSSGLIEARGRATLRGLQRNFGIAEPRLAVAALNPHAGEGGALGREEIELIQPAIDALRAEGWQVTGPIARRHDVPRRGARPLRRGLVHVSRPGADPAEGAALRRGRQHDAWPADRPHRPRPWHRLRHCRAGPRRPARHGGGDHACRAGAAMQRRPEWR